MASEEAGAAGREESKTQNVRSPQTSMNQAEAPKKESMLTDGIGEQDLAAKLDEEEMLFDCQLNQQPVHQPSLK